MPLVFDTPAHLPTHISENSKNSENTYKKNILFKKGQGNLVKTNPADMKNNASLDY